MTEWSLRVVPNPAVAELHRLLGRLRWRLGLERVAQAAPRGLIASSVALIGVSLAIWFAGLDAVWLWLATAPLLAALGYAIVRWPSQAQTARVADTRLSLEERLSTAFELTRSQRGGRFALLQIRDAVSHTSEAPRSWLAVGLRTRNEALLAIAAFVLATTIALVLPRVPRPTSLATDTRTDVSASPALDTTSDRSVPVDASSADQSVAIPVQAQTAPPPPDLANRVQQEQAERAALDKLAQGLGSVSAGQGAADAIQRGDFNAAHDQIQSLGDEADQLSDAAKQQLARGLQQAAAPTAQSDRALADREQQAAQALSRSTYNDQRQALNALADQVQRSGARSVPADQLERDQGQLQQQLGATQQGQASSTRPQPSSNGQPGSSTSDTGGQGDQGQQTTPGTGGLSESDSGAAQQGGAGIGTGASPDPFSNQASRLDAAGQQVQVPTKLGAGPGVRPADGTEDQSTPDPSLGGRSVAEQAQAQQTGQVTPEQNLVPGEQRPVVRGYFK
jgi:hypothetical protein